MKKYLALALATPFVFAACSPDKGSSASNSGGGSNTPSDLTISSANSAVIINRGLSEFATTDDFLSNPIDGLSGFLLTGFDSDNEKSFSRTIATRMQEAVNCDSGSATVTSNFTDVETSPPPATGNSSFEANYNNCTFSSSGEGFSFLMKIDGKMSASLGWTGYDSIEGSFDTFDLAYDIDQFTFDMDINGTSMSFEMDFSTTLAFNDPNASYSFTGSFAIDEAGEGFIDVQTLNPIVMNINNAHPTSGKVVMNGGGNTSISYTVVTNGISVSVNGGAADLYTWDEIDELEE